MRVIHAVVSWLFEPPGDFSTEALRKRELTRGEEILDGAVEYVRETAPGVRVAGAAVPGSAPRALLEQAANAAMLMVGSHGGVDGVAGMLLGSVATQVSMHATTPVAVIRSQGVLRGSGTGTHEAERQFQIAGARVGDP